MRVGNQNFLVELARNPQRTDDNDGFWEPLTPSTWWCAIQPVLGGGDGRTMQHQVTMRFHREVTIDTRIAFYDEVLLRDRELFVTSIQNVNSGNAELRLICEEVQP